MPSLPAFHAIHPQGAAMHKLLLVCCGLLVLCPAHAAAQSPSPGGWGGASWVWDQPNANQVVQSDDPRYLRLTFKLAARPAHADLWVTVDNEYVAYVNGHKVGSNGEWSIVKKYDVARFLTAGKNVLAVEARNHGGPAGALARLRIRGAKDRYIVTDQHTRITLAAGKNWQKVEHDDSQWLPAVVLGPAGMPPWNLGGGAAPSSGYDVAEVDPKVQRPIAAAEELKHFHFPEDFTLELVAAEPLVINPITLTLDEKGRIYVSESHTYRYGPGGSPIKPFTNPVVRLDPAPDGKGLKRTVVADGFADPVMGIAIRAGKLWLTANNYLYQYDLTPEGKAVNKRTILVDKNKAWNPFGMFVLEWGPDGLLYMSVGDHVIDIRGPDGQKITGRRNSGIVLRMNPDGTKMERLVHGLRVPYSFEYDPFGQLWVLSNGEGNPNRFVHVIDGVDYHCYSRPAVDNNWLAGNHPLAPPCFELHRGANTQVIRYYGAAFPPAYQGSLLLDNWGAHGFSGPNRGIFRFVPDEHGHIVTKEPFLSCTDPHFRPSHIVLDPHGNLLVADWYGRDDESDRTGRIWRLKYVGKDRPKVSHKLDSADWGHDDYAVSALSSPDHLVREKAVTELLKRGDSVVGRLRDYAEHTPQALGAAEALWTLARMDTPAARTAVMAGTRHPDQKVRRLALRLLRRYHVPEADTVARQLTHDPDPAVQLEAALTRTSPRDVASALVNALNAGVAGDKYLRYEAAWHLAKHASMDEFCFLLRSGQPEVRLAGLIALDVACFEELPTRPVALAALGRSLENPGKLDLDLLLTVAQLDGDASTVPALEHLLARADLPPAIAARAILVLRTKAGGKALSAAAGKRLLQAVASGAVHLTTPADQLMIFELLAAEGPSEFALRQIAGHLRGGDSRVREAAHALARRFGPKAAPLAPSLWQTVLAPRARFEDLLEQLATLARIESRPRANAWALLLAHPDPLVRAEAVRWWRTFRGRPEMMDILVGQAPELVKSDAGMKEDLAAVFRTVTPLPAPIEALALPGPTKDKEVLARETLASLATLKPDQRRKHALLGQQVFERASCTKCHTTATQTTLLAPSLKGVAAQKIDYLIESVLYPSKVIKTGFESETVVTRDGRVLNGLVKDEGAFLRVLNLDRDERVAKTDVDSRAVARVSIMPEGQEAEMSRQEFVDLIAYLATLR
jgi:quinoprotein glucose dehydrogenase